MTAQFQGFPPGPFNMTQIPGVFFSQMLPLIDDLAQLKVMLYCFWALPQKEGDYPYLRRRDFLLNEPFLASLRVIAPETQPESLLETALAECVEKKFLLSAEISLEDQKQTLYFMNTERGRAAVDKIRQDQWQPGDTENPIEILPDRPTIYMLYEQNIGPLTPMISDDLKDLEKDFNSADIREAIHIAVEANKRSLRYIRGILERWRKEGKDTGEPSRRRNEEDGQHYVTGKYADFLDH